MKEPIVSGSGIRGIFGERLTVDVAMEFAAAFGELCGPGPVALGRDTRSSGPAVEAAVSAGLMATGCTPVMMGIVPTPTVQLEAMREGYCGGIVVTSSHNPREWNALKLIGADGVFLREQMRSRLMDLLEKRRKWVGDEDVCHPEYVDDAIRRHVKMILSLPGITRGRRLKVVLDTVGGAATHFAPELMDAMGVEWVLINGQMTPEGDFPRATEPSVGSLDQLSRAVIRERADIGFGFDPDGDRLALVADNGLVIGEEFTVALAIDFVLGIRPGPAVVNLSTSRLSDYAASKHGQRIWRSPVGEVNVVEEMEKRSATIGGEGNGGVIDSECHMGRDSGVAMAIAISFLRSRSDLTISGWAAGYPSYIMFKQKEMLNGPFEQYRGLLEIELGKPDDTRDGLWFERPGGWTHIRPSGTEPVVRFISENEDESQIHRDFEIFRKVVSEQCAE